MLEEDYAGKLDAEGNRLLKVVSSEAKRTGRLIDDLLVFSRLGRQQMGNTKVDAYPAQLADTLKPEVSDMKVLYMSRYTDDSVLRYGVNHKKVAFLQKPFAPFDLLKKVREVLDKR